MNDSPLLHLVEEYAAWLGAGSVAMLVLAMLTVPWLVCRLPSDYFLPEHRRRLADRGPVAPVYWPLLIGRNLLGTLLILLGLIMLVTPGQGLLTLFVGLWLTDFPGKYALERQLVATPGVLRAVNWIRSRRGYPPLEPPPED